MINSPQYIQKVADAIHKASLGLNPQVEKTTISLIIPKLTGEHRENLAKSAGRISENYLAKLRDINKKATKKCDDCKSKSVSKDLIYQTNEYVSKKLKKLLMLRNIKIRCVKAL